MSVFFGGQSESEGEPEWVNSVEKVPERAQPSRTRYDDGINTYLDVRLLTVRCHKDVAGRIPFGRRAMNCEENLGQSWPGGTGACAKLADVVHLCAQCAGAEWRPLPGAAGSDRLRGPILDRGWAPRQISNAISTAERSDIERGQHWNWTIFCRNDRCRRSLRLSPSTAQQAMTIFAWQGRWDIQLSELEHAVDGRGPQRTRFVAIDFRSIGLPQEGNASLA